MHERLRMERIQPLANLEEHCGCMGTAVGRVDGADSWGSLRPQVQRQMGGMHRRRTGAHHISRGCKDASTAKMRAAAADAKGDARVPATRRHRLLLPMQEVYTSACCDKSRAQSAGRVPWM